MLEYKLEVVQQPERARMCGFGERDRRPIDPPPIVKLITLKEDGSPNSIPIDSTSFVVHVDLWSSDCQKDCNVLLSTSGTHTRQGASSAFVTSDKGVYSRNLVGSLVSSAYNLSDHNGEKGIFFIFPDLSIRTEGKYCLRFLFTDLSQTDQFPHSMVRTWVYSAPFSVYPAKSFPGVTVITELSKSFAKQGIKLAMRRPGSKEDLP
ncbi:hypothetical protein K493DRAFT_317977 [Basidiobolus meristosporus CBS 931.73]|uniref:Velvet domain-containing protein n=1 Tax=Basidiobolus meristosporus CBS 931.73 TaxID=1314790 RepID=A0A1Y1XXG4_9FUNG|nr:hypothetical protein K493DRAFT_317977 [Basidiobolus meristosporus CBS 931.73]|eukprot:ORX90449.1 hypothetical protein K493DRAFT_317977 [Basidiobolus meristosporus CBS 931.73]